MSDFFSPHWYRVATLKPILNPALRVARHRYRRAPWYMLQDPATGRIHRVSPQTYALLGRMDGTRTLDEIWNAALPQLGSAAPTQDELLQLIGQLHAADVVRCDVPPDAAEAFERHDRIVRGRRWAAMRNPLAIRIPLWDPDAFLQRTLPLVRPLVGWFGFVLWALLVLPALVLAGVHWDDLTANLSDRVLSAHNLLLLWLAFPAVKLLHELGHGYATKVGGAQVHEIGLMLLVFSPVPYVDSTRAGGFRSKWGRAGVGAAGMLVETALAALALYVWLLVEPGLVRAICFNVLLIAGVSTVVFNLNPLLKFDGYYILCDLIEMPNLAQRSQRFVAAAIDRRVFGAPARPQPPLQPGERAWLALFAPLSAVYRLTVTLSIALFVATQFFTIGVALALLAVGQGVVWPLLKGLWHLVGGESLRARRVQALATAAAIVAVLGGLLFVRSVVQPPGASLRREDVVLVTVSPALDAQIEAQQARVDELDARLASELFAQRVRAEVTRQALEAEQAALDRLLDEAGRSRLLARTEGRLVLPRAADLRGRFLRAGDLVGHVDDGRQRVLRVVVPQESIDRVRGRLRGVSVRLASAPEHALPARVAREVPAGQDQLPSRALAVDAGGPFALDPRDTEGLRTLNRVFQFDLETDAPVAAPVGTRVFVRFDFEPLPLGWQLWREIRQLFLSRFDV